MMKTKVVSLYPAHENSGPNNSRKQDMSFQAGTVFPRIEVQASISFMIYLTRPLNGGGL